MAIPDTTQIRTAVAVIHNGVYDADACPIKIAAAHALLARARNTCASPVSGWLNTYLDADTTAHGPLAFRAAVNDLAQHFKLPPITNAPNVGEQGQLPFTAND